MKVIFSEFRTAAGMVNPAQVDVTFDSSKLSSPYSVSVRFDQFSTLSIPASNLTEAIKVRGQTVATAIIWQNTDPSC